MLGDKIEEWWRASEPERVVAVLRDVGMWRLANHDGCTCGSASIRNVDIDVSCGKGRPRGIWVSSGSMDYEDKEDLRPIAEEVQRQIQESDHRGEIPIHLHEWRK